MIISYSKGPNTAANTGLSITGTISGTSITYQDHSHTFRSDSTTYIYVTSPSSGKIVTSYKNGDYGSSAGGNAIVASYTSPSAATGTATVSAEFTGGSLSVSISGNIALTGNVSTTSTSTLTGNHTVTFDNP